MNDYSSLLGRFVSSTPFVFGDVSGSQIVLCFLITSFLVTGVVSWRWFLARVTTPESEREALALTRNAEVPIAASTDEVEPGVPEPQATGELPFSFGIR